MFFSLILGATSGMLFGGLFKLKARATIKAWASAPAKVLSTAERKVRRGRHRDIYQDYTFSYKVNDKEYVGQGTVRKGDLKRGNQIRVHYDPKRPKICISDPEARKEQLLEDGYNVELIIGAVSVMIAFLGLMAVQSDKAALAACITAYAFGFLPSAVLNIIAGSRLLTWSQGDE